MVLNIQNLIDDGKCFETVRELRWPGGAACPDCGSRNVTKQGHDDTQPRATALSMPSLSQTV